MKHTTLPAVALALSLGLSVGGLLPGRGPTQAFGAQPSGSVAGWVYWGYCQPYGYGISPGSPGQEGSTSAPPGEPLPAGPLVVYPEPLPRPAAGALVALQGTDSAVHADEDGFFLIERVPLGVYYSVAASYPRRPRSIPAEAGRPSAPVLAPQICAPSASLRSNVIVTDSARPTNVGALLLPRRFGPRPLSPGQEAPQDEPEDDGQP